MTDSTENPNDIIQVNIKGFKRGEYKRVRIKLLQRGKTFAELVRTLVKMWDEGKITFNGGGDG